MDDVDADVATLVDVVGGFVPAFGNLPPQAQTQRAQALLDSAGAIRARVKAAQLQSNKPRRALAVVPPRPKPSGSSTGKDSGKENGT